MGWRFRKSFSPFPGIRLTLSPRGISSSIGAGPLRFTVGPQGAAITARVPGTGIAYREPIRFGHQDSEPSPPSPPGQQSPPLGPTPAPSDRPVDIIPDLTSGEIRSASTTTLTSQGLESVKELLAKAQQERATLLPELSQAEAEAAHLKSRLERWTNGWLFRRIFKKSFARLGERSAEAAAKEAELREQERLSRLSTEFDLPEALKDSFGRMCDSVARLSKSQRIWDTLSRVATDRIRERTTAAAKVERQPVSVSLGTCDLIESSWKVPHFTNGYGGEFFIYPGFILYRVSDEAFALIDLRDATVGYSTLSFIEDEGVPSDSQVVTKAWKKANKDGSPDRRFADNYQIPVAAYGGLRMTSKTGLNEEYMISNAAAAQGFAQAWATYRKALPEDALGAPPAVPGGPPDTKP